MFDQPIDNHETQKHTTQIIFPYLLQEDFRVYSDDEQVINHPYPGFSERILPTWNVYMGTDGGYVAIYTREKEAGVYGVGGGIYVVGQVRVRGNYEGRIFVPSGYRLGDDITHDPIILNLCEDLYSDMKGKIWIGGDTGGWFGIPG